MGRTEMRVPPIVTVLAALLLVVAIVWPLVRSAPRYQIASFSGDFIVRLDTRTGGMRAFVVVRES
jgi:hypothetical protein